MRLSHFGVVMANAAAAIAIRLASVAKGHHSSLASALFASPSEASTMPARPMPDFFIALRRVTDWAWFLGQFIKFVFVIFLLFLGIAACFSRTDAKPLARARDDSLNRTGVAISKTKGSFLVSAEWPPAEVAATLVIL